MGRDKTASDGPIRIIHPGAFPERSCSWIWERPLCYRPYYRNEVHLFFYSSQSSQLEFNLWSGVFFSGELLITGRRVFFFAACREFSGGTKCERRQCKWSLRIMLVSYKWYFCCIKRKSDIFFVVLFIATINLSLYCVLQCEANNSIEIKRNNSLTRL